MDLVQFSPSTSETILMNSWHKLALVALPKSGITQIHIQ